MSRLCLALLLAASLGAGVPAGTRSLNDPEGTARKREDILRAQDNRIPDDPTLLRLITDEDPSIRKSAVHAFGSLQDTSALPLLCYRLSADSNPAVREEAAFAIGQTAGFLSKPRRDSLEHDLIQNAFEQIPSSPRDRLIEELGKFGSEAALNGLLAKFGTSPSASLSAALTRSIARFAIRSVTSTQSLNYLLAAARPPESATWYTAYALQRSGDHPEIRAEIGSIIGLLKNRDPLVRMNCAVLLGKLKDDTASIAPLQHAAESDPDWRVRVNALKALGNHNLRERGEAVETYRRLFSDPEPYVALTSLSVFGGLEGLRDSGGKTAGAALRELEKIALNEGNSIAWQAQAEAATSLAKIEGTGSLEFIRPKQSKERLLTGRLLGALGSSGATGAVPVLFHYLKSPDMILHRSALEGLKELGDKNRADTALHRQIRDAAIAGLSVNDVAVVTTAASMLGDSVLRSPVSVDPLVRALRSLHVPGDVEAMQEIASTLGTLRDQRAVAGLKTLLGERDRSVALAAAAALTAITGTDYAALLPGRFDPLFTDFDFEYLRSLADTVRVTIETSRGPIVAEVYKGAAPFTVMSFLKLATRRSFYRGLIFHRVVPNFVIQGGDPRGDGWGGPEYSIRSEFTSLTYESGSVGIASAGRDTEGSQFFVTQSPQPHLDGRYTLFGKVISGMEVVNKIQVGDKILDVKLEK